MVDVILDEMKHKLALDSMAHINWEVTHRIEKEPKYMAFNKWCDDNGIKHDSVRYPVAFGKEGHLIGLAATRRIGFNEAYLYVPNHVIISEEQFRRHKEIGHILDKHPEVFRERQLSEHHVLIFFVMHEMSKGEESFWYPYF